MRKERYQEIMADKEERRVPNNNNKTQRQNKQSTEKSLKVTMVDWKKEKKNERNDGTYKTRIE